MYYHKRRIIILLLTFSIIFIGLLAFSNHLMKSLRNSEKNMIILWADAVQKRSQLMQDTRDIFQQIDSMEHNKMWKILKELGISYHLNCLLRKLYVGPEEQLEPDMEKQIGSKLGREYIKAVYCHPLI